MARAPCVVVVAALVMFAIIGLACGASPAPAANDLEDNDDSIGALTAGSAANGVVAAPLGGPVPPGAFDNAKGGDVPPSAGSSSPVHLSAVAGAASAALAGFFYF